MTVYSHQPGYPSAGRPPVYPRHLVTAVLVAHDGARWLPQALQGLQVQDRAPQRIVAADTGSTDAGPRLLAESLGPENVLDFGRRTGFGTAVNETVRQLPPLRPEDLPYAIHGGGYDPLDPGQSRGHDQFGDPLGHHDELAADQMLAGGSTEPVEWLWLLHDDCEPAPDALRKLLQVAETTPTAAVIGPKIRSWYDRRQLLEVGVSIARSGKRWTGLDRREQDQGQRDQVRPVLAVSSAGMLIRRDVFEELGGFDKALPLMRDDVDLCWRVAAAGYRTVVAPDAVLRHAEAASRERRPIDVTRSDRPHRIDKAGAVHTLLVNCPGLLLPYVMLRVVLSTLLRTLGYLLGKQGGLAVDELAGLGHVLLRLPLVLGGRARRRRTRSHDALDDRSLFPAPGASARQTVENLIAELGGNRAGEAFSSRHGAVESGPVDEDNEFLEVEQFAMLKRIARRPAPVLFAGLLALSLVACRSLLGGGQLYGGALLPTPDGASDLWAQFAGAWQTVSTGSGQGAPPYLGVLAALSSLAFGSPGLAVQLLLLLSVPLAGVSAYLVSRPLIDSRLVRAWAAACYAFLPAATGAIAQGRIGTAVLAVLLPPLARAAAIAVGLGIRKETAALGGRPSWRSAWVAALLLTIGTAFVPLAWVLGLLLALGALVAAYLRGGAFGQGVDALRQLGPRCAAVVLVPLLVLAPWSLGLLLHPGRLLLEAGIPGPVGSAATPLGLLLLSPGGSGVAPGVLVVGIPLAALAALLRADRRRAVVAAWGAAAIGLLGSALAGTATVVPGPGQSPVAVWAGPTTLLAGIALLAAASIGADGARERVAAINFGWRQPVAALVVVAAAVAPVAAAGWWLLRGAAGPLSNGDGRLVPAFIAQQAGTVDQIRTLVLRVGDRGQVVSYQLVRGSGPTVGSAETANAAGTSTALSKMIGDLVSGSGGDQAGELAGFGVQFVVVQKPVPSSLADTLNATPGLTQVNQQAQESIWRLTQNTARAVIRTQGAPDTLVPAGQVDIDTTLQAGAAGRVLRLAEQADPKWHATLNGKDLTATTVDGWAQGFQLPAEGGRLSVRYESGTLHAGWIGAQCLLALVLVVLALPGRGSRNDDDQPDAAEAEAAAAAAAAPVVPGSRRARRLAANGEEIPEGADGPEDAGADDGSGVYAGTAAGTGQGGDDWQAFAPAGGTPATVPGGADGGQGVPLPGQAEPVWDAFAPTGAERGTPVATAAEGYYADPQQPYYSGQPYYGEYGNEQGQYPAYPQWDGSSAADGTEVPQGWYDAQGYWHSAQDGTAPGSGA